MRSSLLPVSSLVVLLFASTMHAGELPLVEGVEAQPLKAQAKRIVETLDYLGEPLTNEQQKQLGEALNETDDAKATEAIQAVLDPFCLVGVNVNPESRVKVARGDAAARLNEQGWRVFLVKVHNEAGVTSPLGAQVRTPHLSTLVRATRRLRICESNQRKFQTVGWMCNPSIASP